MVEEIRVNDDVYCGNQEDYAALREAVKKLSSASEEQFEAIKEEKWYNRVFDMVTFSQRGKKRIAEQVGTLAQAQQILIELLMRLSENDLSVSKLVVESMDDIQRIQEQNIYLLSKIKKLENISLGIKTEMDLNKLSETNKKVLCACLYYINNGTSDTSDAQKTFANQVIKYMNVDVQMENPLAALEDMETETKKRILNCCMEYMFLKDCSNAGYELYEDFITEFDFGNKTIKSIESQIMSLFKLRGVEGFFSKYQVDNFEAVEDFFVLDFDCEDGIEQEKNEDIEMTDEVISAIMQIKEGETKTYRYKNIHLNAYINCAGNLRFDHCIIYYNETEAGDEITLRKNATLSISNSVVICKGYDENVFIICEGDNQVTIDKTSFEDCCYFLKSRNSSGFIMSNCYLHNCYEGFISTYLDENLECMIRDNMIVQDGLSSFYIEKGKGWGTVIEINGGSEEKLEFYNNSIVEEEGFRRAGGDKGKDGNRVVFFSAENGEVKNCSIVGISSPIRAHKYVNCKFERCSSAIRVNGGYWSKTSPVIDNCVFVECTKVIMTGKNTRITNCQFVSCYNQIISSDIDAFLGGVCIEFCHFINIKVDNTFSFHGIHPCLEFQRTKRSESRANYIKKCIFEGVEMGENFLIGASGWEKPSGVVTYIENCDFKNCSTKRTSGKIIKEYIQYDTILKKNIDFHANHISECRGLDKINKEGVEADTVEVRTTSTVGDTIGYAVVLGTAGGIGGPIALATVAGIGIMHGMRKKD